MTRLYQMALRIPKVTEDGMPYHSVGPGSCAQIKTVTVVATNVEEAVQKVRERDARLHGAIVDDVTTLARVDFA